MFLGQDKGNEVTLNYPTPYHGNGGSINKCYTEDRRQREMSYSESA